MTKNTDKNAKDYNKKARAKWNKENMVNVGFGVRREERERLKAIAKSEGKSLSQYLKDKVYGEI